MNLYKEYENKIKFFLKEIEKKKVLVLTENLKNLTVESPPRNQKADMACNVAMILSKINKKSPIDLANILKKYLLDEFKEIEKVDVAKPGFLNITFRINFWEDYLFKIIKRKSKYGANKVDVKKYNIEFVSANPTGPLHVGHCRGAVIGDVISNLLIFNGHTVTKEYYVNDYGGQVKNFIKSVYYRIIEILENKKFPEDQELYPGDYVIDIAKKIIKKNIIKSYKNFDKIFDKLSKECLHISMETIKANLSMLNVKHNSFIYESEIINSKIVSKTIEKLKKRGLVYTGKLNEPKGELSKSWKPRNQLLFKSTNFNDDIDRALQKENKDWTYFAGDIGYHANKFNRNFDILINILGADHAGYIKRIQSAVNAISNNKVHLLCIVSQLVKLFKNNKPFKMSKRQGDYITVEDLINEVGKDSVRFMMISRNNDVELDFDFQKVTEKSKDNPVFYVQYAYARINSIFRILNLNINNEIKLDKENFKLNIYEKEILNKIAEWPRCIEITLTKLQPHIIPTYLYELSTLFHAYWNMGNSNKDFRFIIDNKISNKSRLILLQSLEIVINNGMSILGVSIPKSM